MNQQEFTADLFIKDEYFQRWVYTPDPQIDLYWKTFLKDNPECQEPADEAKRFLLLFTNQENDVLKSRISNLKGKIDNAIDSQSHNIPLTSAGGEEEIADTKIPQDRSNIIRWAVAASILLLAGASVLFFYPVDSILDISFADHQEQKTQKGQHSVITLEDGTKVWLNADSRLEYPKRFSVKETRQVFLEGEGYFIVTRNVNKPFIVNTSGVSIRVLGTLKCFSLKTQIKRRNAFSKSVMKNNLLVN
jgi:transmembrane sensor